jgi:hypothetical protein
MKNLPILTLLVVAILLIQQVLFLLKQTKQLQPQNLDDPHVDPYALARRQSFGFFDDITEERWRLHQKIYQEYTRHKTPDQPLMYNPAVETRTEHWWNSPEAWYQNVRKINSPFHCIHV